VQVQYWWEIWYEYLTREADPKGFQVSSGTIGMTSKIFQSISLLVMKNKQQEMSSGGRERTAVKSRWCWD
jgi:hypothetical protein